MTGSYPVAIAGPQLPAGVQFRIGDAVECLRGLTDRSVQSIVTSPPYFRQRNYGVPGELGLERTPAQYVGRIADVMDECWRVLADDGLLFLNLGDTYASRARGARSDPAASSTLTSDHQRNGLTVAKLSAHRAGAAGVKVPAARYDRPAKSLLMMPARCAIELQERGWVLRSDVIWRKPNPMPESAKDRPTLCHEHVFMLAKQPIYTSFFDQVEEPAAWERWGRQTVLKAWDQEHSRARFIREQAAADVPKRDSRNLHSVWTLPTANYGGAHFAVMPELLADLCIRASTRAGDTVLDPFMGAGTTLLAAVRLGRDCVGIDADPKCLELTRERLVNVQQEAT